MVLTQDYRLIGRPMGNLQGTLRFNQYHYDNQTDEHTFGGYVAYDASWHAGAVTAHPFGNDRMTYGLDLDYDIGSRVRFGATAERIQREHTHREVEKDAENAFAGRFRLRPIESVTVKASWRHGERELDEFNDEDYRDATGAFVEQPGLRRFDVADRRQDDARGGIAFMLGERVEISADYGFLRNDYHDSPLGLQEEEQQLLETEGTIHWNDRTDLSGGYGFGRTDSDLKSRQSASAVLSSSPADDWRAQLEDDSWFVFGGAEWWAIADRLAFSTRYEFGRAEGEYDLSNGTGTAQDVPKTFYRRHDLGFETRYRLLANLDVAGRDNFEQYDVTDFAAENIPLLAPLTGAVNAIYLGDSLQD
jgi:hypothetical protein